MGTEDYSKMKVKLSLVQMLHHNRCKSLMTFKAIENLLLKQVFQQDK